MTQRAEAVRQSIREEQERQLAKAEQERQAAAAAEQQANQASQSNQTTSNQAEEYVMITRTGRSITPINAAMVLISQLRCPKL